MMPSSLLLRLNIVWVSCDGEDAAAGAAQHASEQDPDDDAHDQQA